jgi:hypothetical protein
MDLIAPSFPGEPAALSNARLGDGHDRYNDASPAKLESEARRANPP